MCPKYVKSKGCGPVNVDVPIDHAIPSQKDCARYKMHKYWAGKPWYVVAEYIRHFTREGDIVLDPFCGGGVVGCEALINRRKAVLNDLNPMAAFIAKNTCRAPVDLDLLLAEFGRIGARVKDEIMDMYRLKEKCPICGGDIFAKHVVRGPALNGKWIAEARCINGHGRADHIRRVLSPEEKDDIEALEDKQIPFWFPDDELPDGREIMRLKSAGMTHIHQLFTRRNLMALSIIYHEIGQVRDEAVRDLMLMAFSNTVLHASKLKSESLRPMSANSYYCMGDWIEENVWERFENRVTWRWGVYEGKRETNRLIGDYFKPATDFSGLLREGTFMLFNRSAQDLSGIPASSIDYCFTDPPYGGSIQYSELTFLWRSWLGMKGGFARDEIIVNDFQKKKEQDFEDMLKEAFGEIYRVLKPGRWLSVTFNNRDQRVWMALLNACGACGFEKVNIVPQKPLGNSFVQSWTGYSLKRDLILNFRKPARRAVLRHEKIPSGEACSRKCALRCKKQPGEGESTSDKPDMKDIIISTAGGYLEKNRKATLPELFEAVIIKWIDRTYGRPGVDASRFPAHSEQSLDMALVDCCLQQASGFQRLENNKQIIYELKKE